MAQKRGNKSNYTKTRAKTKKTTKSRSLVERKKGVTRRKNSSNKPSPYQDEIIFIGTIVTSLLLLLSNFNMGGKVSDYINYFTFGMLGFTAYFLPFILFFGVAFYISNRENKHIQRKGISIILFVLIFSGLCQLIVYPATILEEVGNYYKVCGSSKSGGGLLGSFISSNLVTMFGVIGAYIVIVAVMAILLMFLFEKFVFSMLSVKGYEKIKNHSFRREKVENEDEEEEVYPKRKAKTFTFPIEQCSEKKNQEESQNKNIEKTKQMSIEEFSVPIQRANPELANDFIPEQEMEEEIFAQEFNAKFKRKEEENPRYSTKIEEAGSSYNAEKKKEKKNSSVVDYHGGQHQENTFQEIKTNYGQELTIEEHALVKEYEYPPFSLLARPRKNVKGESDIELKETAIKLQSTLESFGVHVTITNVSCGPAVTRYEIQPEQGVKVSKITNLADDIKLNLAAADVRIEAPIPGKAAVGIEVPNKVNSMVLFRELIEGKEFKEHESDIAFAVGKDIGGQTVVTDIAKMPHLLIAGATGSGKSVCINTLIMSILYKANPEDVKLIMIDPKVVELSIYNGIPHLLIPVVTDPKKASGALNWAVTEMTERYKKFADYGVRDIKGYNNKIAQIDNNKDESIKKLPQIVIIVDELADLMMVAPGEVEDAICRLAQMARAAGLHLIIATQRPSVNVITGVIKANVPSRIAFSVSSAIDSRTILDSSGAEKLLGKGDMLFFPSGYAKPIRVQGAFISDKEVSAVVEFLAAQNITRESNQELEGKITSASFSENVTKSNDKDEYFVDAGKFIIEKDKASIGMLQRVFKIGFNRAARIMDQLYEAGVVGPEEGTKPRKVLMSESEFEQYIEEYV